MKKITLLICLAFGCILKAQEYPGTPDSSAQPESTTLHLGLEEKPNKELVAIQYPNPITSRVIIKFQLKNINPVVFDLEDPKGTVLLHDQFYDLQNGDIRIIDVMALEPGLYILRLSWLNHVFYKRIIKIPD